MENLLHCKCQYDHVPLQTLYSAIYHEKEIDYLEYKNTNATADVIISPKGSQREKISSMYKMAFRRGRANEGISASTYCTPDNIKFATPTITKDALHIAE